MRDLASFSGMAPMSFGIASPSRLTPDSVLADAAAWRYILRRGQGGSRHEASRWIRPVLSCGAGGRGTVHALDRARAAGDVRGQYALQRAAQGHAFDVANAPVATPKRFGEVWRC